MSENKKDFKENPQYNDESIDLNEKVATGVAANDELSHTDVIGSGRDNLHIVPEPPVQKKKETDWRNAENQDEKVSYGSPFKQQVPQGDEDFLFGGGSHLKQSEHLRMAQKKINDLEEEIIQLRRENEDLASAGETFKKLSDEYFTSLEDMKSKLMDEKQIFSQEIGLLKKMNTGKEKQISEYKQEIEDYKSRIDSGFQRVRKREKELEHRLEIAKMEEVAVIKNKDQLILDLKKKIDEISNESDNFRQKSQENYREFQKQQQTVRNVIRVLRIALTQLEGNDDSYFGLNNDHNTAKDG